MKLFTWAFSMLAIAIGCSQLSLKDPGQPGEPLVSDTCDNPDANIRCLFANMPATPGSTMVIASAEEPGEPLVITGSIKKKSGSPVAGAILYAYHTDSKGLYSKKGNETGVQKWHGYLHGWCKTDANGRYEIRTIRPARYPDNSMPAHIHAAIREAGNIHPYYVSDFVFRDDSLVNDKYIRSIRSLIGGDGIVDVKKSPAGIWEGERNIIVP